MKLFPTGDRVILKLATPESKTESGIILPDSASKEMPDQAEVVAVGPGRVLDNGTLSPMHLKVGDKVLFRKMGFDVVKVDGVEHLIMPEILIIAVIE